MREDPAASRTALLDSEHHGVGTDRAGAAAASRPGVLGWGSLVTRLLGAGAVLVIGAIHLHAHDGPYSAVPTVGQLFILNAAAATVIGVALLAPIEHLVGRRAGAAMALLSAAGIALAVVSLVMLIISEHGTLFGFHEPGYDPTAIARSKVAEVTAVGLLTTSLVARALAAARPRW